MTENAGLQQQVQSLTETILQKDGEIQKLREHMGMLLRCVQEQDDIISNVQKMAYSSGVVPEV